MQFWAELLYKLYTNSNVSCMRDVRDPDMGLEWAYGLGMGRNILPSIINPSMPKYNGSYVKTELT